jgi:hypothetical protein
VYVVQSVEFRDRSWPLVYVRFPREFSPATLRSTIDGFERVYQRRERFAVLADGTDIVKFPAAAERKMLSDWMSSPGRPEKERLYTIGTAIVLTSGPMRAMMSAISWVSPPMSLQVWKATSHEGFEWCYQRLVEAKVPITDALEAARAEHGQRQPEARGRPDRAG